MWDNQNKAQFVSDKTIAITSSLTTSMEEGDRRTSGELFAFKQAFGGDLDGQALGAYFADGQSKAPYIVGTIAGSGAHIRVTAYASTDYTDGLNILKAVCPFEPDFGGTMGTGQQAWTSSLNVFGATLEVADPAGSVYGVSPLFQSLYAGAGYNLGITTAGETSGNSVEVLPLGSPFTGVHVNEDGELEEPYKVGFVASGGNYFANQFSTNIADQNLKSDIVIANIVSGNTGNAVAPALIDNFADSFSDIGYVGSGHFAGFASGIGGNQQVQLTDTIVSAGTSSTNTNSRFIKMVQGTYGLGAGTNGDSTVAATQNTAIIGGTNAAGEKTGIEALDDDLLNISVGLVPGLQNQKIQNALITVAERTQNFVAVVAPPYGVGATQDAINWGNGQSPYRTTAINSSWAAAYWPWLKTFSTYDAKDRWYDPTIFGARSMVYTDAVGETWFAPAGYVRGKLTKPSDVEVIVNQGDRDSMYSGGNTINPIVNFPQQGVTVWGQRTMQKNPSALDRINVRRLMIFLRKLILSSTRQFVFEPNDPFTWSQIVGVLAPALGDIKSRRGIIDYKVICDETTNTPVRIDRNELWCKVLVKPTKTAEMLIFELNLTSQGATIS